MADVEVVEECVCATGVGRRAAKSTWSFELRKSAELTYSPFYHLVMTAPARPSRATPRWRFG